MATKPVQLVSLKGFPIRKIKSNLKKWFVILLALLISSLLLFDIRETQALLPEAKQKGMSFVSWWPGDYSTPDADLALFELKDDGAGWISLL